MRFPLCLGLSLSAFVGPRAQMVNALTEAEKSAGWELMFDGKSLAGWHSYRKTSIVNGGWIIQDSALYLRGNPLGGFAVGAVLAPEQFVCDNFDISIDWKLPDSGNSGIFLRYLETEEKEAKRTGPETQICGKADPDYRNGADVYSPGACYDMFAPARPWIRPANEYNTLRVVMFNDKVAHFGNGIKLLEYTIGDSTWKARYEVSKYSTFPLYGDIHAGKLLLQDHASHVWYRNIKIRRLATDPWTDPDYVWPDRVGTPLLLARDGSTAGYAAGRASGRRLVLSTAASRPWDLRLIDPLGRLSGSFRGTGEAVRSDARVAAGFYLVAGGTDPKVGRSASRSLVPPP
jgi:hypothetical protein